MLYRTRLVLHHWALAPVSKNREYDSRIGKERQACRTSDNSSLDRKKSFSSRAMLPDFHLRRLGVVA
jgi:hypothetical protein